MSKIHREEIITWAQSPEGTKVWCKRKNDKNWGLMSAPGWFKDNHYIVDGPMAERRKKAIDSRL